MLSKALLLPLIEMACQKLMRPFSVYPHFHITFNKQSHHIISFMQTLVLQPITQAKGKSAVTMTDV